MIEKSWKTLKDWNDISAELQRTYHFPFERRDGTVILVQFRIDDPKLLLSTRGNPLGGDSHRVIAGDRSVYVPRGWIGLEWTNGEEEDLYHF